jgi:ABC-type branched-subunit amino acid transport system ATPase component/ABC-type branched-subunit amino acid transport system permease subunit
VLCATGWVTPQLVFDGLVNGLVIGLLALGLVLVYRSSQVINFAVANLGLVGASLFALLTIQYRFPFWIAVVVALAVGAAFSALVELAVVRRLFTAPRVILLVATIGVAQLAVAVVEAYPDIDVSPAVYPVPVGATWSDVLGDVRVTGPQLTVLVVVPLLAGLLAWFLNRTTFGRAVTASASNRDLARLSGVNPKLVSTGVWAIAGLLATVSMVLIAGQDGSATNLVTLGPNTMVRALAAATVARFTSFPKALLAGAAIGVLQAVIAFNFLDQVGLIDFLLFLVVLIAVLVQSAHERRRPAEATNDATREQVVPEHLHEVWWVRHLTSGWFAAMGVAAIALPLIVTAPSRHLLYTTILGFAICALSLTVLTGWAGQLSLGQMAFAGIGALSAASFARGITISWSDQQLFELYPVPFVVAVLLGALVAAACAAVIGVGALRVRGLLLAVSTFAFAVAAQQYLFRRPILAGEDGTTVSFPRGSLFGLDLASQRTYYYVVLAVLAVVLAVVVRFRRSGIGRTTLAVRDNADTAAAYSSSAVRTKLRAFALAGGIAGLGGALLAGALQSVPYTERFFRVEDSLLLVAMVVIGGLSSPSGAILGSLWVVGLAAFFPDDPLVPLVTSSLGLLVLLMYFPKGVAGVGLQVRAMVVQLAERRHPAPARSEASPTFGTSWPDPGEGVPALEVTSLDVRFGGITAVAGADLTVRSGEIVGLIGANGAGKSTLLDAVGGFVPSSGSVALFGEEVQAKSSAARARRGLGRTFQAATLFPSLTVRETVLVALESRGRTGVLAVALALPSARRHERTVRAEAAEIIDFLGLGRYADRHVATLSTGTRRIVELAGLLALDARFLCLDEPTAGVAQREAEAFGPLITEIRRELGASMLVVEHDLPLIISMSDRIVCLETGLVIADGSPETVREDPRVIASYLGDDPRAIDRSDAGHREPASTT